MARKVTVQLIGDSDSLERAFDKAGRKGQQFDSRMGRVGSNLKSLGKAGAAGIAVTGVAVVTSTIIKGIAAAKEAEVAQARLRQALKASGSSYQRYGKQIDAAIDKTSRLAGIDDEELSEAFSQLVRTTGSVTKATKGMNLAANIARARGISLASATKMVEKAMAGSETALKRVGIVIPKVSNAYDTLKAQESELREQLKDATDAEKKAIEAKIENIKQSYEAARASDKQATASSAIEKAQRKFAGSAEAYGKTAAGAQERFSVALENLQERIGKKLLPLLTKLALWGVRFLDWSEKNWPKFSKVVSEQWEKIRPVFEAFKDYFGGFVKIIQGIITGDWSLAWKGVKQSVAAAFDLAVAYLKAVPARLFAWGLKIGEALAAGVIAGIGDLGNRIANALLPGSPAGKFDKIRLELEAKRAAAAGPVTSAGGATKHPGRAHGGPVLAGRSYTVGERGRETLTMGRTSGFVTPGGGGVSIGVVHVHGVQNVRELLEELQRIAKRSAPQTRGQFGGQNLALG